MQIDKFFPYRLVHLARAVDASMAEIHTAHFGLSSDEWRVLSAVAEADPAPTRDIAQMTGLDKVAISRAASRLEERGLIRRHEAREDRRIKILHLTNAGGTMVQDATRIVREREAYLLEALSAEERLWVNGVIDKLAERAEVLCEDRTKTNGRSDGGDIGSELSGLAQETERTPAS
jgi:DNA-binding MarR family transcriptional regulator